MRRTGKITDWKDDKGFGFIIPNEGGQKIFAHIKSFKGTRSRPVGNEVVTYAVGKDAQGRLRAINVMYVNQPSRTAENRGSNTFAFGFAAFFFTAVTAFVFSGTLPSEILLLYVAASAATFLAYAADKSAARKGRWRIPEAHLHLFALSGGWPGALFAQRKLRHKSRKTSFQVVFWITVMLNIAVLGWLFTADGSALLDSLLDVTRVQNAH